jgi:hypothetical protein
MLLSTSPKKSSPKLRNSRVPDAQLSEASNESLLLASQGMTSAQTNTGESASTSPTQRTDRK